MINYFLRRFAEIGITLIGITFVSFLIIQLAPGKPTDILTELNPKITPEARARLEKYYGLDKPVYVQYLRWLKRVVRFDFGDSFSTDRRPVWDKIKERLPITIFINIAALVLIFAIAIPVGVSSAVHQYSTYDKISTVIVFIGFAIPTFWLALLLMILFGVYLDWLPISGIKSMAFESFTLWGKTLDLAAHLVLPITLSAFSGIAGLSRYMRSNMLEVIRQDFIVTARAKGLPESKVIYKHALRNAILPIVTILGLSVPSLIGGSVIFENIFSIPGMGQLFFMAVMMRDYPLIMGILTIGAILTLIGNLMADVGYSIADPRIRTR